MHNVIDELKKGNLSKDDTISILTGEYDEELFEEARKVRENNYNNMVYVRGIIDVSNYCMCTCKFCGNSCATITDRYRLTSNQIIDSIKVAQEDEIDLIHLASGLDYRINEAYLDPILNYCNENGIEVEMAVGIKDIEVYKNLIGLGAKRFIMKFETSNEAVFNDVKNCHSTYEEYISFIKELKELDVCVGSGNIIGLPGTTLEDVSNDIELLKDLNLNMISTSVFTPNKESAFANEKRGNKQLALRFVSIILLLQKDRRISIPTNSSFGLDNKVKALSLGANVLSVNYTNKDFEKNYSIYDGGARYRADFEKTLNFIREAGMQRIAWKEFKKYECM